MKTNIVENLKIKIKEDWKTKIKDGVTEVSVYSPDLLKIMFSSRSGLQFEKKREIRGNFSRQSNKNDNLPEGRDNTQGNYDEDNKKLSVHVKNLAI